MHAIWALRSGTCGRGQVRLLGGELVVEGLPLALFARRHPELVGLTPIVGRVDDDVTVVVADLVGVGRFTRAQGVIAWHRDRKSTRLNSSHLGISYAVFC